MPLTFTKKIWKNRTDPTLVIGTDPEMQALEFNRIETGIKDTVDEVLVHEALTTTAHGGIGVPPDGSITNAKVAAAAAIAYSKLALTGSVLVADLAFDPATQAELDAAKAYIPIVFSRSGVLTVVVGSGKFPLGRARTVTGVRLAVGTAPTGAAILVDVNKNGTTMFTTQGNRPTIAAGSSSSAAAAVPDVTALVAGDLLSVDVDQIGSTIAGSDLTVVVEVQ